MHHRVNSHPTPRSLDRATRPPRTAGAAAPPTGSTRVLLGTLARGAEAVARTRSSVRALDGVWRLGRERGAKRVELWYVAELPVEGRAAVPQLLLEARERVVVLPIDPGLMAWYAGVGGPDAVGWTPEDPSGVREALSALG
jgi:hypothetical protein